MKLAVLAIVGFVIWLLVSQNSASLQLESNRTPVNLTFTDIFVYSNFSIPHQHQLKIDYKLNITIFTEDSLLSTERPLDKENVEGQQLTKLTVPGTTIVEEVPKDGEEWHFKLLVKWTAIKGFNGGQLAADDFPLKNGHVENIFFGQQRQVWTARIIISGY